MLFHEIFILGLGLLCEIGLAGILIIGYKNGRSNR